MQNPVLNSQVGEQFALNVVNETWVQNIALLFGYFYEVRVSFSLFMTLFFANPKAPAANLCNASVSIIDCLEYGDMSEYFGD